MNVEKHTAAEVALGAPDRAGKIAKVGLILALYGPRQEKDAGQDGRTRPTGIPPGVFAVSIRKQQKIKELTFSYNPGVGLRGDRTTILAGAGVNCWA